MPTHTPYLSPCIGALQVGWDALGWAIWQKDQRLFRVVDVQGHTDCHYLEPADIVRPCDPPWPYPFPD